LGAAQAIAGARHVTRSRKSTPNWRNAFIGTYRIPEFSNAAVDVDKCA
jgi:hypothetical protein